MMAYRDIGYRGYKVIDVSGWQEGLDFDEVVNEGVRGVIIKISEGLTPENTWWGFVTECAEHNLPFGVYCYSHAQTQEDARQEANEVLYLLTTTEHYPVMGVWYDVEDTDCFEEGVDTTAICEAFCDMVRDAGYTAGVYSSSLKFTDYMTNSIRPDELPNYLSFWIADYRGYNGFAQTYPHKRVAGWQYSDSKYIGNTNVDMNEWYDWRFEGM